jgi:hypothetical protein
LIVLFHELGCKEIGEVRLLLVVGSGDKRRDAGVGFHLRGIEIELPFPD